MHAPFARIVFLCAAAAAAAVIYLPPRRGPDESRRLARARERPERIPAPPNCNVSFCLRSTSSHAGRIRVCTLRASAAVLRFHLQIVNVAPLLLARPLRFGANL